MLRALCCCKARSAGHKAHRSVCARAGAFDAVVCEHWQYGGRGAVGLARAVARACEEPAPFRFLYDAASPIKAKIEAIAREIYRASGVEYSDDADAALRRFESMGFGSLPICMAKTQYSFSHDAAQKGAPSGFVLPIRCGPARCVAGAAIAAFGRRSARRCSMTVCVPDLVHQLP
jgi:formyltetrahydrofolate synthetase